MGEFWRIMKGLLFAVVIIVSSALLTQWAPYQTVLAYFQDRGHLLIIGALVWWIIFVNVSDVFSNFNFRGAAMLSTIFLILWLIVAFGLCLTMVMTMGGDPMM